MKYFTVEEAEALIPEIQKVFAAIGEIRPKADVKVEILRELKSIPDPDPARLALEQGQLEFLVSGMNEWMQKILDMGAMPKGMEPPLVDFPYRLDGKEVYLCWTGGDRGLTHYHGIQEGFAGRKKLPAKKYS